MGNTEEQQAAQAAAADVPEQNETGAPVVTEENQGPPKATPESVDAVQEDLKAFQESFEAHAKSVKWMLKEHPRAHQLIDRLMEKLNGVVEDYIIRGIRPVVHHFTREQIENSLAPEMTGKKTYDKERQRPQ